MNNILSRGRSAFTLVELMTVIAIIVLLIGILIPALSSARTQAKQATSAGLLSALDRGCELFRGDLKHYPRSRGVSPFEADNLIRAMGAQWLAMQLVGVDGRGFVNPTLKNDSGATPGARDGVIDDADWNDWYALNPTREYTRLGPYAAADSKSLRTISTFLEDNRELGDEDLFPPEWVDYSSASTDWTLERLPFFVDAFGYPILYYRANAQVDEPFTTGIPQDIKVGRYDQADNAWFTGSDGANGRWPIDTAGWDLTAIGDYPFNGFAHPLGDFGYPPSEGPNAWPDSKTFAEFVCDRNIFENTVNSSGDGRLWPYKPNTFLLISTGKDGVYGTGDDVTNFRAGPG